VNPLCAAVRRRTAWVAVVAILLGALLPSMSHGVPSQDVARTFVRVCTAAGMKLVAVDEPGEGRAEAASHGERCAFCATHCQPAMQRRSVAPTWVLSVDVAPFPHLYDRTPRPPFVWLSAIPRGPPVEPACIAGAAARS